MEFRKKIDIPQSKLRINHQTGAVLFGSCFAENIGRQLLDKNFKVNVNPFGVLYNPLSISQAIELLLDEKTFTEKDTFFHQDLYHTFFHHSSFSNTDQNLFLESINLKRKEATKNLKDAGILLITFGTSYVFRKKNTKQIVGNCHKLPTSEFSRDRLNIEDIVTSWSSIISRLREKNPSLKILFTVSPIRHWKDGAHNNQLSKAVLLLSIEQLVSQHSDVFYFPSYEIVLDELRDYRFYSEDMIHPNEVAIRYIWEVFENTFFDKETVELNNQWTNILKAISHRPFNPNTDQHKQFLRQTLLKIKDIQKKYPYFDCRKEEQKVTAKISSFDLD